MRKSHLPFLFAVFLISSFFSLKSQSNLWGVTTNGGNGGGSLFGIPTGSTGFSTQYNFTDNSGQNTSGASFSKMLEANGKLYGMTTIGGANNNGVIYEYDPIAATYTKKMDFAATTGTTGAQPNGSLIQATSNGRFYGMAKIGGANGFGTIFQYIPSTNSFSVVTVFTGTTGAAMGSQPVGSLLEASNGKLYGVTSRGGNGSTGTGLGVIFQFDPATNTYSVLASFTGATGAVQGGLSQCTLIESSIGKLQGLTVSGGAGNTGVLFEYDFNAGTYTKLYDFGTPTGSGPNGSLLKASNGKYYGTTATGGANSVGVIFEYDPSNATYSVDVNMAAATGSGPFCTLMQSPTNGKLYGTTRTGGANSVGTVFEYDIVAGTYTKKADLATTTGSQSQASLMQFSVNGKIYGVTPLGGSNAGGVIFEYDISTGTYTKKIDFNNSTGGQANGGVTLAANGKLYGMTTSGGAANAGGVIFEYDQVANIYLKRADLTATNGRFAYGALTQAANNVMYGLTSAGGTSSVGTIISYNPGATSYTKIVDFTGTNGSTPYGSVVQAGNGNLYGVTSAGGANGLGVLFEYNITSSTYTKKYDFTAANGANPFGSLVIASNGKAYGVTSAGGANSVGVVFEYDIVNNIYTKKIDLTVANGSVPYGALVQANGNFLYGMTRQGGANSLGVIFEYNITAGTYAKKIDFTVADGSSPYGSLTKAANGKLYGLTTAGGANSVGVMFEYDPVAVTYTKKIDLSVTTGGAPGYTQLLEICTLPVAASAITSTTNAVCNADATLQSFSISTIANATSYTWTAPSGAAITSGTTNNVSINFSAISAGVYTLSGAGVNVCGTGTLSSKTITVNILPVVSVNSGTICNGDSFTISPSGASTYTIQGGSANVSPATSTNYTVTGTDANGCVSASPATSSVTVNASPVISVNSGSICNGDSFTISPSGASSYTITGSTFTVSPTTTSNYTVTGSGSNGCISTAVAVSTVVVNTRPSVSVNSGSICSGSSFSIMPAGADSYTITGGSFNVSPSANTNYSVTGSSIFGCLSSNTAVATVSVYTTPTVSVNSGTICAGQVFTILPAGADVYTITGNSYTVSPSVTTSYTLSGASFAGCAASNQAISTVSVFATPVITASSGSICTGGYTFDIVTSGANSYTITGNTFTVSPSTTTSYSVTGTSTAGCVSSNPVVATVSVYTTPVITSPTGTICSGQSFTVTPSGAGTYTITGGNFIVSPTTNTSYVVSGTSTAGCVSATNATVNLFVNVTPTVSATSGTICNGNIYTITPGGANSYTVSGNSFTVNPSTTTVYTVTGTGANGCVSGPVSSTVTVNIVPAITANSGSVCAGGSFTISPSGAASYAVTGNNFTVTPSTTTTYTVSGTTSGCTSPTIAVTVTVNALPVVSITSPSAVCIGSTASLVASGSITYSWTPSASGASITASPATNTTYSVTGTDALGCSSTASVLLSVNALPVVNVASGAVCPGQSYTLAPSGAITYTYSSGSAIVSPASTTSYTVAGTDVNGCVSLQASATVTVTSTLPVFIAGNSQVCSGEATILTAGGASTYSWSTGSTTSTISVTPLNTGDTFSVVGSSGTCSNTASVVFTVLPAPFISAVTSAADICIGQTATLTANGALSYTWSTGQNVPEITVSPSVATTYTLTGSDGTCSASVTLNQVVSTCIGIETLQNTDVALSVYPNPNNGEFNIDSPKAVKITVLNTLGSVILTQQLEEGKNTVNLSAYAKGIYFVQAVYNKQVKTIRIAVQ